MLRLVITVLLLAMLSGCGFHLRGAGPQSRAMQSVQVRMVQPYRVGTPPLVNTLRNRLRASGSLSTAGSQSAILTILGLDQQKRVLAVSPLDGRAVEYQLTVTVDFKLSRNGRVLVPRQSLSTRKAYTYDHTQPLAEQQQENAMLAHMQQQLANLMLLRLDTLLQPTTSNASVRNAEQ